MSVTTSPACRPNASNVARSLPGLTRKPTTLPSWTCGARRTTSVRREAFSLITCRREPAGCAAAGGRTGLMVRAVALESCCGRRNVSSWPLRLSSTRSGSTEYRVAPSALSTESPTRYVFSWPRLAEMMAWPFGPPARMPVNERLRLVSGASTVLTTGAASSRTSSKRCAFASMPRSV